MRYWLVAACFLISSLSFFAQGDEAARANALWSEGKRIDALPLYEDLVKSHPNEWLYQERLADALGAAVLQTSDPVQVKALRIRERDAAKRAVDLGDPAYFVKMMAQLDPEAPIQIAPSSPGGALLQEAEKAFAAGDFDTAMAKYTAAAAADPQLYEAPLYAGDTAYTRHDLDTAATWFARAIAINPNRETAYRYWGDAILRYGSDPMAAKEKFIDAIVAEPYNKLAWQGIDQWAQRQKAVVLAPRIDRPNGPTVDPKNPKNVNIAIDFAATDDKKNPGASAWMMYSIVRASYHGELFTKEFPGEKQYRHTLKEEDAALSLVATTLEEKNIKPDKMDESLRNLIDLQKAGMLDCWILINAADDGIAQDYEAYRKEHRRLLHDYMERFVVHGGVNSAE